ncbi:MAG: subclass B3 metallo-beta-lactamase [Vicinamibacterales bacterium]|nr:subclass B3 metallo-beta-lactamase [Vicinamibacterales bacterium]
MRLIPSLAALALPVCLLLAGCTAPEPAATPAPEATPAALEPDPPMVCSMCDEWNTPRAPFQVFANTYYVGTAGLSSMLIATDAGLVLIDVALPQSAPLIDANIRALGFRTEDVKYILTSHAHFDHLGGVASMQRYTGATVLASASSAEALALGHPVPSDPQYGTGPTDRFPAITDHVRVVRDGETLELGGTTITARYTPGHTPGATSWTWPSCEGERCLNMVYVDSLTAVSRDDFLFTSVSGLVETFRETLARVRAFPCDVVIATHPAATGLDERLAGRASGGFAPGADGDPLVDPEACVALADRSLKALDERVALERP